MLFPVQIPDNGNGYIDGETIQGAGSSNDPFRVASSDIAAHDGSLTGNGSVGNPLGVSIATLQPTLRIVTPESGDPFLDVDSNRVVALGVTGGVNMCTAAGAILQIFGGAGSTQPTINGSRTDGTALADLLTKLATIGLIVDGTTP